MPTDPNMTGLIYPTEGDSMDIWGQIMNATCWPIIGAHDHTTGNGVKIPSAALKINADVSWSFSGTNYAVTDAKAIDFAAVTAASVASYAGALFVNSSDANNLYFRTVGGTNVKITDGTTLNVSIVGGIGGDYSSIGALLDYDDATDTYRFRQETAAAVRQFAKIKSADLLLGEYKASGDPTPPTNFVTLKSPAGLAAGYSLTHPAALPASSALRVMSSTGTETFATTATITGDFTANDLHHTGTRQLHLPPSASLDRAATHTKGTGASGGMNHYVLAASANPIVWPIELPNGSHIKSWSIRFYKNTDNTNTVTGRLYKTEADTTTETALGASQTNNANAPGTLLSLDNTGLDIAVGNTDEEQFYLVFTPGGGVTPAADTLWHAIVTYTYP